MDAETELAWFASRRRGVFTIDEARRHGLTERMLDRRTARGAVVRVEPGVYRFAAAPRTWEQDVLAACLAEAGWASHRTAAALWRLDGCRPGIVEVLVPRWKRRPNRSVRVHETRLFEALDQGEVDGIPVTSAERTLADLGALVPMARVEVALDDAWNRRLVTPDSMWTCLDRLGARGRPWIPPFRRLVAERSERGGDVQPNLFERLLLRLVRRAGLPEPETQVEIRRPDGTLIGRVDVLFGRTKLIIECDGMEAHNAWSKRRRDFRRDRELHALGYRVLRVSWEDVTSFPDQLLADIRAALQLLA